MSPTRTSVAFTSPTTSPGHASSTVWRSWPNTECAYFVELREVPRPEPGHGQVRVAMRASTICGSDLRAIYREHLGEGPEGYRGVIGGHEPPASSRRSDRECTG